MLPTETRKQNFLSCNSMKKNKWNNNNASVLTDNPVLHNTMAKTNCQDWFVWNTDGSEKAMSLVWSDLAVDIEHECVLDGLERHEGVQGLAPQRPPMIRNAGPKVKQGEIIFLKS